MTDTVSDFKNTHRPRFYRDFIQGMDADPIATFIREEIANQYQDCTVIEGGSGLGKSSLAGVRRARRNCERWQQHPFEPCGECDGCRSGYAGGGGFDDSVNLIDATQLDWHKKIQEYARFGYPAAGWYGNRDLPIVIVIDEFWRATAEQQATVLSALESGDFAFILLSSKVGGLQPAIYSRSHTLTIELPDAGACVKWLMRICAKEGMQAEPQALDLLVRNVRQRPRKILTALQDLQLRTKIITVAVVQAYFGSTNPPAQGSGGFGGLR
jgi:DNA polymerase III gamma/tau subunit